MAATRYALIGTGSRARSYVSELVGPHAAEGELVALFDVNPGRLALHADVIERAGQPRPLLHSPDDLERVIREQAIDRVIITSPDRTHAEMIVRAQAAGADVVVEKPLTINVEGCRAIVESVRSTGRDVVATFNYRYSPRNSALKAVVDSGRIGDVTSVHFEWVLDTNHGADYFRRWHRDKKNSGGLLVHKASHHFDLINWWISDVPVRVFASGGLRFYGAEQAARRGLGDRPERGTPDSPAEHRDDPFLLDLRTDPDLAALYLDNEHFDGYRRDLDVFGPGITIEDNLSLVVDYRRGASMSYSLNAHSPWEGYIVSINGTKGRAELTVVERSSVVAQATIDPSANPQATHESARPVSDRLVVQQHWAEAEVVPIVDEGGAHGGGDARLFADVFSGPGDDPLHRAAGWLDGLRSVATGIAANQSLQTGEVVRIDDLQLGSEL